MGFDKLATFELLLVDRSDTGAGNFDVEFNYDTVQWETGDAAADPVAWGHFRCGWLLQRLVGGALMSIANYPVQW
jgi:hypothetical protein